MIFMPQTRWKPSSEDEKVRFTGLLSPWQDTPYRKNTCLIGQGVDCVNLVGWFLMTWTGFSRENPPWTPRKLLRTFPLERIRDFSLACGDIIVVSPGHLMISGPEFRQFFHSSRVIGAGWTALSEKTPIRAIYRPLKKDFSCGPDH